jgi:hypothetical protein
LRSEPSSNVTETIEKTEGARIAPARPWSARAAISIPAEVEKPHRSEKAAKSKRPSMKSRRRPSRSPDRPPRRRKPPKVKAYALTTHWRSSGAKSSSVWIEGSATFTIETSRTTIR